MFIAEDEILNRFLFDLNLRLLPNSMRLIISLGASMLFGDQLSRIGIARSALEKNCDRTFDRFRIKFHLNWERNISLRTMITNKSDDKYTIRQNVTILSGRQESESSLASKILRWNLAEFRLCPQTWKFEGKNMRNREKWVEELTHPNISVYRCHEVAGVPTEESMDSQECERMKAVKDRSTCEPVFALCSLFPIMGTWRSRNRNSDEL